ncbi:uncharacterized protein LOC124292560 [Haliotis rubra]|uniref:uncharacterized protein LOC124292560 n=1 Tax=Haliotis rubra TaxID=36100 RepID=UPI001EE62C70|nr:uncharacterized protein LOC124292560 [Haliotis rubra]
MEQVAPKRKPNPKRLEKTLFVNHKAEQALEKRLESISLTSRLRMMELDRERITLKNEYRLSRRRNVSCSKPRSRSPSPFVASRPSRHQPLDPVNAYLLTEYRRVSEVIPSILMSLSAKEEQKQEFVAMTTTEPNRTQAGGVDEPDMSKIQKLIRNVKKMRQDMNVSKRLDSNRCKVNFKDLMKNIEEREQRGSPSDTYTDGACSLLRRKMNKMRREGDTPMQSQGLAMTRSVTTLGMPGRQKTSLPAYSKSQLAEEDEFITRTKVSRELENYDKIRGRIGTFMDTMSQSRLPPLEQDELTD